MYTSLKLAIVDKTSAGSANVLSIYGQAGCTEVNLSMDFSIISQSDFFFFFMRYLQGEWKAPHPQNTIALREEFPLTLTVLKGEWSNSQAIFLSFHP